MSKRKVIPGPHDGEDKPHPVVHRRSSLVSAARLKKVESAFSTCSESFCGITSTLSGREFRDISARDFHLQDVLHDEGYQTWFLLSGNHGGWNGLPQFYHASDDRLFDGPQTRRYTMDDDRLVLEGFVSTHYLGSSFRSHTSSRVRKTTSARAARHSTS